MARAIFAAPLKTAKYGLLSPEVDPFYSAPEGFESMPRGTILKHREMNKDTYGIIVIKENFKAVYQLLVRSEDSSGEPIAAMTTVFVPFNSNPSKLLSYQTAEDSTNLNCATSYAMQLHSNTSYLETAGAEQLLAQAGMREGWYLVVPDYEGPRASWLCGYTEGHIVLDSIRATLNSSNITGIYNNALVALWGYSGGSFASGWAANLQPIYAPELKIVGVAMGGVLSDVSSFITYNIGKLFSGFSFAALNGWSHDYPELKTYLKENIYSDKYSKFMKLEKICEIEYLLEFAEDEWDNFFPNGDGFLNNSIVKNITEENSMISSRLVPKVPLYFYHGKKDEIISVNDTNRLYEHFCEEGVDIEYHEELFGGEHILECILGGGRAFNWLKDRLDGKNVTKGCTKTVGVQSVLTPEGLSGFTDIFKSAIFGLLGSPVGKNK